VASLVLVNATHVYLYAWLIKRGGITSPWWARWPPYLQSEYLRWCAGHESPPGWKRWLLPVSWINVCASLFAFAFLR